MKRRLAILLGRGRVWVTPPKLVPENWLEKLLDAFKEVEVMSDKVGTIHIPAHWKDTMVKHYWDSVGRNWSVSFHPHILYLANRHGAHDLIYGAEIDWTSEDEPVAFA